MRNEYLEFERPLAELDSKIDELRRLEQGEQPATGELDVASNAASPQSSPQSIHLDITDEIATLERKSASMVQEIYKNLSPWQIAQVARHPMRPHTLDYIREIFTDFQALKGDRTFADDPAIVAGLAKLGDQPVMVVGHQKGRTAQERVKRNFGMPKPEGYRKALRLMKMAEQFGVPILTFIDTPGAYPGVDAEERGQSEAIAMNIQEMSTLSVPIIATVIGEGGSGGALAIGVCDHLQMLEFSTYSVISPEGCASILWKSAEKASDAAAAMGLTADRLHELSLIDQVISEPLGGAHRHQAAVALSVKEALEQHLSRLLVMDMATLLEKRYQRLMAYSAL